MARKLNDWIGAFMEYTENTVESPVLFRKWVAVTCISSALQRKCYTDWGLMNLYPNLYVVLVAPSGKARKGSAMSPGFQFLSKLGIRVAAEATTRESLIRELKNSSCSSTDPETGKINFHSSLTIYSQELSVFLGYNNKQLISDLTDWYDCRDRWTYRTKTQGEDDIIGVYVTIIGATTPDMLRSTLPSDAEGGGLTSRIIFVFEKKKGKTLPAPFLGERELELREHLAIDLETINMMSGPFKFTKTFFDKWFDWYSTHEDNLPFEDERFNPYFERRPTHLRKLAMIMCASREGGNMTMIEQDFDSALELLLQTEKKMSQTLHGVGKSGVADVIPKIMAMLMQEREVPLSLLMSRYYYDITNIELMNIVKTLETMEFAKLSVKPDGSQVLRCVKTD